MANIPIVVFHHGRWNDSDCYENYTINGVLVNECMTSFVDLVSLLLREVQLESSISFVQLSTLLNFGMSGNQTVFHIKQDKDVMWYLTLVKNESTKHPLVIHAHEELSGSRESDRMLSIVAASSSSSNNLDFQVITNIQYEADLKEKDVFGSKEILSKIFHLLAVNKNFQFKIVRSNPKSIEFQCSQNGCQWYVRASRYKSSEMWMLRKYVSDHNCSMNSIQTSHRQASSSLIADYLKDEYRLRSSDQMIPKDIMHKVRMKLGVNVSYYKAWRAKEQILNSLNGDAAESYGLIPKFFTILKEMNPGL